MYTGTYRCDNGNDNSIGRSDSPPPSAERDDESEELMFQMDDIDYLTDGLEDKSPEPKIGYLKNSRFSAEASVANRSESKISEKLISRKCFGCLSFSSNPVSNRREYHTRENPISQYSTIPIATISNHRESQKCEKLIFKVDPGCSRSRSNVTVLNCRESQLKEKLIFENSFKCSNAIVSELEESQITKMPSQLNPKLLDSEPVDSQTSLKPNIRDITGSSQHGSNSIDSKYKEMTGTENASNDALPHPNACSNESLTRDSSNNSSPVSFSRFLRSSTHSLSNSVPSVTYSIQPSYELQSKSNTLVTSSNSKVSPTFVLPNLETLRISDSHMADNKTVGFVSSSLIKLRPMILLQKPSATGQRYESPSIPISCSL